MLRHLHVRNYVLIDSLDIEFPEGLVIITGQTGAGKSILLGSVSLALGGKSDISMIGPSGDNCVVEAEFDLISRRGEGSLRAAIEDAGAEWDDGHLILRRVIGRTGRSRAFVNDCPVSASVLQTISSSIIDIHSQHRTLALMDRKFQLSALDAYAGNARLLDEYSGEYSAYSKMKSELEALDSRLAAMASERDYNESRFRQLDEAMLREGELEELEAEQKLLANAEEIKTHLYAIGQMWAGSDEDETAAAGSALKECGRHLDKVTSYVPKAGALRERLESALIEMEDIFAEIAAIESATVVSPERMEEIDQRLSLLYGLMQRFGCRSVEELIAERDRLGELLYDSTALEEKRDALAKEMEGHLHEVQRLAAALHEARVRSAGEFAAEITSSLRFLELEFATFEVRVDAPDSVADAAGASGWDASALGPAGVDSVTFLFSAAGGSPVELSKCASGGEMSRIMLCLKDLMARYTEMPTMIFDEIDTGVSGSVADKMGSMICRMGEHMQVFAITHLPQVAAKGRAHYLVSKSIDPATSAAVTDITRLDNEQRVMEVARMLSGSSVSPAAIANARALLASD